MTECEAIRSIIERYDMEAFRVVSNGEIVVLVGQGRTLIYNRATRDVMEIRPDYEVGVTVYHLGRGSPRLT